MPGLIMSNVYKAFGETQALRGISLEAGIGGILALLGPSGCGKSTALSIIAGLEKPDQGQVFWNGEDLSGLPSHRRGFGLMFQDFALFPHMNVFENVIFGLRMARLSENEARLRVQQVLELVRLEGFERRDVNTLSGGEQQRVALARSLAPWPRLLMLDEPLGSLDRNLRERLVADVGKILRETHQTAIYVTHDQEEAFAIADRVVIMNSGRVEQSGTPADIYRQPASAFVARFLGLNNLMEGVVHRIGEYTRLDLPIGQFDFSTTLEGPVKALLRPERVSIDGHGDCQIEGQVAHRSFRGNLCRLTIEVGSVQLDFDFLSSATLPDEGQVVKIGFEANEAFQIFPE